MSSRLNNRDNNTLRPVKITKDFTKHAISSILIEVGDTRVLATVSVEEGKPKWMDKTDKRGWVTAEYALLPTSTHTRVPRERNKLSGRTQEIQRLVGRSLRACVNLEKLNEHTFTIDCDVLQADGGTRCASICAGFMALKESIEKMIKEGRLTENPIIEPIAAISAGIVDGEVKVDLDYSEDSSAQVDANIVMTQSGKIIEFQTTAEGFPFEKTQLFQIMELAENSIKEMISKY